MIRKFTLINSKNEKFSLNDKNHFAYAPGGLGVVLQNDSIETNAKFIPNTTSLNQGSLSLNIIFGAENENAYKQYQTFVNFLNYQPLTLQYDIDTGTFYRLCNVQDISKSEINEWNVIDETLTVNFITPWFKYIRDTKDRYIDQENDGKIYRQVTDGPSPTQTNLLPDPEITSIDDGAGTGNWYTHGSSYAWTVVTDSQYVTGYNVAVISQNEISIGNAPPSSQKLNIRNIDTSGQAVGSVFLLTFYFKSDAITEAGSDLEVRAYNSAGDVVPIYDIVDNFASILKNVATYYLDSKYSGEWIRCKIAYEPQTSADFITQIEFNFQRNDSVHNYLTAPIFVKTDAVPLEDSDAYYIYTHVYEEEEMDINADYYNIVNGSVYYSLATGSPIEITIKAIATPVINPSWELWSGSTILQSDRYFLTIPAGYKLIVSSFPEDQYARLIAPDGAIENVYQYQDLTKTNFVTIPEGSTTLIFDIGDGHESWRMREEWLVV